MVLLPRTDGLNQNMNNSVAAQTNAKFRIIIIGSVIGHQHGLLLEHDQLRFPERVSFQTATADGASQSPVFGHQQDRKSTRLNSSHVKISYAVFCLKKKKRPKTIDMI